VLRWPKGRAVTDGRSSCDHCGQAINAKDLIPLASFVWLRGKCRACGARIDRTHIVIEGLCALIGGTAMLVAPGQAGFIGALSGWLLVALAALDLAHFWLPDRLTGLLVLVGIVSGLGGLAPSLLDRVIGAGAGFITLAVIATAYRRLRRREGLGGGDPKLLSAIGAMLGWQALPFVVLGASSVGLLFVGMQLASGRRVQAADRLPLGALMALAAFPLWMLQQ
jgi:leader peptidase (prepilin peptidase)/N-methyltransferase